MNDPRRMRCALLVWLALASASAGGAQPSANGFDRAVLHPAIPLVDEDGRHVRKTGNPYSTRMSCGNGVGGGCHDVERMTRAYHFQQGREETRDDFGAKRGLPQLSGPGYFGGFSCMQGSMAAILAKKSNASAGEFGDFGAAGQIMLCGSCHAGGGWGEVDRSGKRYERVAKSAIAPLDGDYHERDVSGKPVPWDWKKSGTREADCLICHVDLGGLKGAPLEQWGRTQEALLSQGNFRAANSAWFEILGLRLDGQPSPKLLRVGWTSGAPARDGAGRADLSWNAAAFDADGKVQIPMLRFPASDNCMLCHLTGEGASRARPEIIGSRRGFYGFGEETREPPELGVPVGEPVVCSGSARPTGPITVDDGTVSETDAIAATQSSGGGGGSGLAGPGSDVSTKVGSKALRPAPLGGADSLAVDWRDDVHKGKAWRDDGGESRIIDNCNACHARQYYKKSWANVDLNADHNFLKGNGDSDVRNDLDNQPGPASCVYCHSTAKRPALPSGQQSLLDAHRERWKSSGYMCGYPANTLDRVVQVHFNDLSCSACHSPAAQVAGREAPVHFRYRVEADGQKRAIPYVPNARFFAQDRATGRMLYRHERLAVLRSDGAGHSMVVDPETGSSLATVRLDDAGLPDSADGWRALKRAWDSLLRGKGYKNPDTRFVYAESNEYFLTHQTRAAERAVPCLDCHNPKPDGSVNGAVAEKKLMGHERIFEVARVPDRSLVEEGVVELAEVYHSVESDGRITESVGHALDVTREAPDLSILKAATARVAGGVMRLITTGEAARLAGLEMERVLRDKLGHGKALSYVVHAGDDALRGAALFLAGTASNQALMDGARVELSSRPANPTERTQLDKAGGGTLVSEIYALNLAAAKTLGKSGALLKLPYAGVATQSALIVLVTEDGKSWGKRASGDLVALQPPSGETPGFVLLKIARPLSGLALVQAAEAPVKKPGKGKAS